VLDDQTLSRLLGTLYGTATQPDLWNIFLTELCALAGVSQAALIAHQHADHEHRVLALYGDEVRAGLGPYEKHYWQFDEWSSRFPKYGPLGRVFQGEELWPEDSLRKSVFYNEFLKQFDACQMAAFATAYSPGVVDGLSVYRAPREKPFDAEQLAVLQAFAPHLTTALATRRKLLKLETRVSDLENGLDRISSAFVLVDAAGKAVFINRAARQMLDRADGLTLHNSGLKARTSTESARLTELILKAVATGLGREVYGGGAMRVSRPGKRPLHVLVSPLPPQASSMPRHAAAAIFFSDPVYNSAIPSDILQTLFHLTPAEVRLTLAIFSGNTLSEAAQLNQVSRETVKSQMASVFQKTGARRQAELIRLLSSLAGQIV
jgi:DNA-binding CsgD family transcriptional regulator